MYSNTQLPLVALRGGWRREKLKDLLSHMANRTRKKTRTDQKNDEPCKEMAMAITLKPYKASGGQKAKAQAECVWPAAKKMNKTEKSPQSLSMKWSNSWTRGLASPGLQPKLREARPLLNFSNSDEGSS